METAPSMPSATSLSISAGEGDGPHNPARFHSEREPVIKFHFHSQRHFRIHKEKTLAALEGFHVVPPINNFRAI